MAENDREFYNKGCLGIVLMAIAAALLIMCCSCTRTVYVPQTSVQKDSIYLTQYKRDSIYLHDSVLIHSKADTLIVEKWHTKLVKLVESDTLYIERNDTISEPYPVEKPLTYWQKSFMSIGKVSLGVWFGILMALLIYFVIKRKRT